MNINNYMLHEIEFALTTYCQARCRSCSRTNSDTGETVDWLKLLHMDIDMYKNILESNVAFKDLSKTKLTFCGEYGDPMMHPKIEEFMTYTATRGVGGLLINTNGGLRSSDWYHNMAKFQNISIEFGIDGTDYDTNWKYREGVDWDRAMANMRAWFANNGQGYWAFLLFEWNWHQIPTAIQLAKEIGCTIEFKLNRREHGLLSSNSRSSAVALLKEYGYDV